LPDQPSDPEPTALDASPADPADQETSVHSGRSGPPSVLARNLVIGPLILLVIASWLGDAVFFAFHDEHPLAFIALNARNRNLLLASPYLDTWSYYIVGTLRLLASDPLFFLLGIWYGDAAVRWMERKSPTYGKLMRSAEQWFGTAAYPLVALAPNNYICLFAGAAGMNVPVFFVLNVGGTLVRLWLLRWSGDVFSRPLHAVSGFITDHRVPVLLLSVALVAFTVWNERRRGAGEISDLAHLDDEVDAAGDAGQDKPQGGDRRG